MSFVPTFGEADATHHAVDEVRWGPAQRIEAAILLSPTRTVPICSTGKHHGKQAWPHFEIELLHRTDEHREQRHDLYAPHIAAAVVQARALFRAISPDNPSLVSFRIIENGLIAYETRKGDLG
jgi:hypothetical protein